MVVLAGYMAAMSRSKAGEGRSKGATYDRRQTLANPSKDGYRRLLRQ